MLTIETPGSLGTFSKLQSRFCLKFIDITIQHSVEGWRHTKYRLDNHQLLFVAKGALYVSANHKSYTLSENQLLICPPYTTLQGDGQSPSDTTFYRLDFFTDAFDCFRIQELYIKVSNPYRLTELFKEMLFATRSPGGPPYAADALTLGVLTQIGSFSKSSSKSYEAVRQITEWIEQNATLQTTARSISDHFGYNKDHLSRLFKAELRMTLKEYLNAEQVKAAKSLLLQSDYTIKKIAGHLGYDNENLFVKFFKYHEGLSPTAFRKVMDVES